jgi:acetoacetate decarboxylase
MFRFEDNKCYRMPAHFGGWAFDPNAEAVYHDVLTLAFSYKTDGNQLAQYVPEGFELLKPELTICYQQCRQIDWMAGSYYNLATIAAPVSWHGRRDHLGGAFALVVWENKTTPIQTGNMMGVPKIFADIEDPHIFADTYCTRLSYEGSTFLELEMAGPRPLPEEQVQGLTMDVNTLGWRYIPKVGGPGAELSQPTLFPMRNEPNAAWIGSGTVKWTELTWEQSPLHWGIVNALARLPILEMEPVMMTRGCFRMAEARGRVLA